MTSTVIGKFDYEGDTARIEGDSVPSRKMIAKVAAFLKVRPMKGKNVVAQIIEEGDKAKVVMYFRGREIIRPELGMKVFDKIIQSLTGKYQVETNPRLEGNHITMVVAPKS